MTYVQRACNQRGRATLYELKQGVHFLALRAVLARAGEVWCGPVAYVDDIVLMTAKNEAWDHARFERDFETSIYFPPLKLIDASERNHGNYLEMEFAVVKNQMVRRLKNENKIGEVPQVWRYQHFESHGPSMQKRALVSSSLQRASAEDGQLAGPDSQRSYAKNCRV